MALKTAVGSFAGNTNSNTDQSVTGLSFQPSAVIFWGDGEATGDGIVSNSRSFVGMATGSSNQFVSWRGSQSGTISTTNCSRDGSTTLCILFEIEGHATPTQKARATFKQFNADGFTVTWQNTDSTSRIVNYLALGGSDIINATVGNATTPTSTGDLSETTSFQPDLVFFIIGATSVAANAIVGYGWACNGGQAAHATFARDGQTTSDTSKVQTNTVGIGSGACLTRLTNSATVNVSAYLKSLNTTGFTLHFGTVSGTAFPFAWLAIQGGSYAVNNFSEAASNVTQSVNIPFLPTGIILLSSNATANASPTTNARSTLGATDTTNQGLVWTGDTNGDATTVANSYVDRSNVMRMETEGGTPSTQGTAVIGTVNNSQFNLTWSNTDGTARDIVYLAMGSDVYPAAFDAPTEQPYLEKMEVVSY